MSFGISVGDFITVGRLIENIVSSLRASSISEYHELILELHGLQRALFEIEHLKCLPSQELAVSSLKVAALLCQHPLDEFAGKLRKLESLGLGKEEHASKLEKLRMWGTKLRWGFCMKEEVLKLRGYIVVHVGSLNMRLITQGLQSTTCAVEQNMKVYEDLDISIEKSKAETVKVREELGAINLVTQSNNSVLTRLSKLITGDVVSQLRILVDLASSVWRSNMQIMSFIVDFKASTPSPDLRYTWFQDPIRFEDALGLVIPVPSEYTWEELEAIILARFRNKPGYEKINAGEYELFNTFDSSQTVSRAESETLTPGLSITMAIIIGHYNSRNVNRCPRPGCKSMDFVTKESGGKICRFCRAYFDLSQKTLPLPLRPPGQARVISISRVHRTQGLKRKIFCAAADEGRETQQHSKKSRIERKVFKNFRVQVVPLAPTPTVSNVRRFGNKLSRQIPTTTQDLLPGCASRHSARQKTLQSQQISSLPGTTSTYPADVYLSNISYSPQLAPNDSVSNRGDSPASSSLCSTQITPNDRSTSPISRDLTVASEPYWLARSDLSSAYTTQTAWNGPAYINPTSPDSNPTITCPRCNKVFKGSLQDALSNLRRHQRCSPHYRHSGLKCPLPECRAKRIMRSDNLGPHLLNYHDISSKLEVRRICDEAKLSARREDSLNRPRHRFP